MSAAHLRSSRCVGRLCPAVVLVAGIAAGSGAGCASSSADAPAVGMEPSANAAMTAPTAELHHPAGGGGEDVDRLAEQVRQYTQRLTAEAGALPQVREPQPAFPGVSGPGGEPVVRVEREAADVPAGSGDAHERGRSGDEPPVVTVQTPASTTPLLSDPEPLPPPELQRPRSPWGELATAEGEPPAGHPTLEQQILARLGKDAATWHMLDYHLLRLLEDEAPVLLAGDGTADALSREDQQILSTVTDGLRQFREELRREGVSRLTSAEKIAPIVEMSRQLRRDVGLTVPTVALCSEVRLFGNYDPLPLVFPVGQPRATILYVEVDNFASRQGADGWWEARMTLSAVLYDEQGRPLFELPEATASDRARQRRRDFFLCTHLTLPAVPRSGEYTLKVTVRDDLAGRIAEESLRLRFTGN